MTDYNELKIKLPVIWAEFASEILLNNFPCKGVVTEEIAYKNGEPVQSDFAVVKGYLWNGNEKSFQPDEIRKIINEEKQKLLLCGISQKDLGNWEIDLGELKDTDWSENWKRFWKSEKIGEKIVICPSWEKYQPQNDEIIINLDPGSAFGTGSHATTRLCIKALEKYIKKGGAIADIGTGSGILAVCGAKLGAKEIVGVDNDPSVIEIARDNASKNNVGKLCNFFEGSAEDLAKNLEKKFDVVVSNILAEVLASIAKDLTNLTKKDGIIILSGIIEEKQNLVKEAFNNKNCILIESLEEENWILLVYKSCKLM
jgi:ribosomal protein L11 methyltransferase